MAVLLHEKEALRVDADGFLEAFDHWDEEVAAILAARENLGPLRPEQMDILLYLRDYYSKHRFYPILRAVCRKTGTSRNCLTREFSDPVQAWKVAGLPNPGEEIINFHSWNPLGY